MIWALPALLALWLLGWAFGVAARKRLALMAAVWLAYGLALALGLGDLRAWGAASLFAAMVSAYIWGLRRLKSRAAPKEQPIVTTGKFTEAELGRYARHILLREIGGPGQRALKDARVLVIGAGGLGSPAILYLAAAGVGTIGVIDDDTVDESNLQRQIIHETQSLGQPKVQSAEARAKALNPHVTLRPYQRRFSEETAPLLDDYDLILDGSDNFDTRYLVNRLAAAAAKPLISAAITQWEGQLSLYDPARGTPCYECVFPERPAPGMVPTCAEAGVVAALPGVIGAMMALEAIKHLTGAGETLRGRLLIHDALYAETRSFQIARRPDCPVCGGTH